MHSVKDNRQVSLQYLKIMDFLLGPEGTESMVQAIDLFKYHPSLICNFKAVVLTSLLFITIFQV